MISLQHFSFSKIKKDDVEKYMGLKLHPPMEIRNKSFDAVVKSMAGSLILRKDLSTIIDDVLCENSKVRGWRWRMETYIDQYWGSYVGSPSLCHRPASNDFSHRKRAGLFAGSTPFLRLCTRSWSHLAPQASPSPKGTLPSRSRRARPPTQIWSHSI